MNMVPETTKKRVRFASIPARFRHGSLVHTGGVVGSIPTSPTILPKHLADVNEAPFGSIDPKGAL